MNFFVSFLLLLFFFCKLFLCDELPVIQKVPPLQTKIAGQKLRIGCVLESGNALNFFWYKDNEIVIANQNVNIQNIGEDNSLLTINSLQSTDAGQYKCLVNNSIGNDFIEVQVQVQGNYI